MGPYYRIETGSEIRMGLYKIGMVTPKKLTSHKIHVNKCSQTQQNKSTVKLPGIINNQVLTNFTGQKYS